MRLRFIMAAAMLMAALPAPAESFTVYDLGGDDVSLLGINAGGTVLIQEFSPCPGTGGPTNCYEEFTAGTLTYQADSAPSNFVTDNGSCSSLAGGSRVCGNGGYEVFEKYPYEVRESYPGGDSLGELVYTGSADGPLFVNGSGDFATLNGNSDELVEVQVAETPEPSSFLLLGTGVLGMAGVMRKRFV